MSSFHPLGGSTGSALSGAVEPTKFTIIRPERDESYYERRIHPGGRESSRHLVIVIIISALIFVTVIAIFDILKSLIGGWVDQITADPDLVNLLNSFFFGVIVLAVNIFLIYLLVKCL